MTSPAIQAQIQDVFRSVLRQPTLVLNRDFTANDVVGWDSLNHAILLSEVQKHFGIRFSVSEVIALKTVGELVDLVSSKQLAQ